MIWILFIATMTLSLWAAARVKSVYSIAPGEEATGVKKVLDAAAWTYVAAFVTSFAYFLWHLLPLLLGGNRSRD